MFGLSQAATRSPETLRAQLEDRVRFFEYSWMPKAGDDRGSLHQAGSDRTGREPQRGSATRERARRGKHAGRDCRGRVLVVDDEAPIRKVVRKQLERAGYQVVEASNGAVAMEQLQTERVDVVITDILMPEKDGIETIIALRGEHPGIKIIAISAPTNQLYLETALRLGADLAFPKPFSLEDLERAVDGLLE